MSVFFVDSVVVDCRTLFLPHFVYMSCVFPRSELHTKPRRVPFRSPKKTGPLPPMPQSIHIDTPYVEPADLAITRKPDPARFTAKNRDFLYVYYGFACFVFSGGERCMALFFALTVLILHC